MFRALTGCAAAALAVVALPACAQPKPADADPALWVVKDEDTTVYLFGTVHVLKPGMSWFDEAVKTAFDRSDTLALEIVQPDPAAMQKIVLAKGINATGPTLTERLPADKRAEVVKALTEVGLPSAAYDRMKPWLAAVTVSVAPLGKLGYDPNSGAEKVLAQAAQGANKQVVGLETAEQQLGFFDAISEPAQVKFLVSSVEDLPKLGQEMDRMVASWAAGRTDELAAVMNDNLKDSPEVAKLLLTDRNKRWAEWIDRRMDQPGIVFVAVGAGHLAGPDAVQEQLKAYKLDATRVKY